MVPNVGGTAPLGAVRNSRVVGAETGDWGTVKQKWAVGAIGYPVNNYISVVFLTLSDQMS